MLSRRQFLISSALAAATRPLFAAPSQRFSTLPTVFAKLEQENHCRLGVYVLDTRTGETAAHRANERFAMCSTFKSLLAAAVLQRVDAGHEQLDRKIQIPAKVTLGSSYLTAPHAGGTMTVRQLAEAIIVRSDNTAANLLLDTIDGPAGMTSFYRSLGDDITRLDRTETTLNEAIPGDPRDTTSPAAMVANWRKLLLGKALTPASRTTLTNWLINNQTGGDRLRKGLPTQWTIGDKTGSNGETTTNDVAILWPQPDKPPVLIATYLTECPGEETRRNGIIASVGRILAEALA